MSGQLRCTRLADALLGLQMSDGSWPTSRVLRVPDQQEESGEQLPGHGDGKRLMSTAMVSQSLKLWLNEEKRDCGDRH
jgi:hypothetical protein